MSVMADSRRARSARSAEQAPPQVRRTLELWLIGIGMVASLVTLGGFSLVMNQIDEATFATAVMPTLFGSEPGLDSATAFEAGRTLGAWFGFTLVGVLLLSVTTIFFTRRRPWRRTPGWWALAAGLACLLGSQFILFPVAFVFFVAAGSFALRPVTDGSPS